jgi:hypothetical protein
LWTRFFETSWPECKLRDPASQAQIDKCEDELNVSIPLPLQQLLRETDGVSDPNGECLIFSIDEMIECTEDMWFNNDYEQLYQPFVSLLFFGTDAGDNLFAYPILGDKPDKSKVFRWRRDNDSRMYYADGLEQYFYMRWKCLEQRDPMLWDQTLTYKDFDDFNLFLKNAGDADFSPDFSPDSSSPGSMRG